MATATRLSLEEFLARPETKPASEYVCGEVERKPMPTGLHGIIQGLVLTIVRLYLMQHPVGEVGAEWRCVFGPSGRQRAYVPDVVFVSGERLPADPLALNGPFRGAPDLAVEILSPSERPGRLLRKVTFYLRHGVRLVWVLDPRERSVTVYRPDADDVKRYPGEEVDGGAVLPGFRVPVEELFPRPRQ